MSLINDALKRTQQSSRTAEPPCLAELELRPIEAGPLSPESARGHGAKRILWLMVVSVVALNIALWLVFKDRGGDTDVAARTLESEPATTAPVEAAPTRAETANTAPVQPPSIASPETAPAVAQPVPEPVIEVPPAIVRPEFKLKTIVRHPVRPSAMINKRVLFVGDQVEGYTVTAIGADAVTLARDGDEVTLSLP